MTKRAGIWLDFKNAFIIEYAESPNKQKVITINSEVEDFRPSGGSGGSIPYGPQDAISESKFLERKKHQLRDYFNRISVQLQNFDEFFIFGPADAKVDLKKFVSENNELKSKLSDVATSDIMTENQMKERVRNHYN